MPLPYRSPELVIVEQKGWYDNFKNIISALDTRYDNVVSTVNALIDGTEAFEYIVSKGKIRVDSETTTETDVLLEVESDYGASDTVKFRVEGDGEVFSDVGFTTFSPEVSDDPISALKQAAEEINKPRKPYSGILGTEQEKKKYGKDISKIVLALGRYVLSLEERIRQLEKGNQQGLS